jgi:calcium binding protein 39
MIKNLLFGRRSPKDLVLSCVDQFKALQSARNTLSMAPNSSSSLPSSSSIGNGDMGENSGKLNKIVEELSKNFAQLKQLLYGEGENEPKKNEVQEVAKEVYSSHFLLFLVSNLEYMEFEARRDAMQVFNNLIKLQMNGRYTTVDYICSNPQILYILLHGYEKDTSILSGNMLRECIKHEVLARKILTSEQDFFNLFSYVDLPNFDVASDAFLTFRELLSRHKSLVAEFLDTNFDQFFAKYAVLLQSNYVTKRQSLKVCFLFQLLIEYNQ